MEYIQDRGAKPKIEALAAPPADPKSLTGCFDRIYKHEIDNTRGIYNIVEFSMKKRIGQPGILYNGLCVSKERRKSGY